MAGVDAAIAAHPWIDGDRLGVFGGSYGCDVCKSVQFVCSVANDLLSLDCRVSLTIVVQTELFAEAL